MKSGTSKLIHTGATLVAAAFLFTAATAFADTSVNIQSISPGATVSTGTQVTFTAVPAGFNANTTYSVSDSFSGSTITSNSINGIGTLYWTPTTADIGTHNLSVTVRDNSGATASAQQQIIVTGAPTVTVQSLLPSSNPAVGSTVTFTAVPTGFPSTSYSYSLSDTDPDTTITSSYINSSGQFSWKPTSGEQGLHTITITVNAGGTTASVDQRIIVGGSSASTVTGRTVTVSGLNPSTGTVAVGTPVTATITPSGFTPNYYYVTDSFSGTSVAFGNVNVSGSFSWTPTANDVGTHTLTFTGSDASGNNASVTATITVTGATSVTTPVVTPISVIAPAPVAAPAYVFSASLQSGSTGQDVLALQAVLVRDGYLSATPTGTYGPATTAAVKAYQSAHGLSPLGIVGPGTRAALNAETGVSTSGTTASVTTTTSTGMSTATKQTLLQIALQLQQLAAQLTALASSGQ